MRFSHSNGCAPAQADPAARDAVHVLAVVEDYLLGRLDGRYAATDASAMRAAVTSYLRDRYADYQRKIVADLPPID
jgi:hypothetical protein